MKQVDREIGDMISSLTRRLAHLQKKPVDGANVHHHQEEMEEEEDNHRAGVGMITMAGTNEGATMRGEITSMDQDNNSKSADIKQDQSLPFTTYLNNNVQSVNNSIMVGGSYSANDPGIHLDVDDYYQGEPTRYGNKNNNKKNKNKESFSGSSTSDHSS